jgi:predicted ATP-grasp superfamily ATP-dependent carboligase
LRNALDSFGALSEWVQKHRRSAGGRNILRVPDGDGSKNQLSPSSGFYFQRRIVGRPISAVFVADGVNASLLGITAQLIGDDGSSRSWCTSEWTGAKGFWYAGSIGPIAEPEGLVKSMTALGDCIANEFHLRGIFGVDAILTNGAIWSLEVNPRYTASVEVLERATGLRAIELHANAFCEHVQEAGGLANAFESLPSCPTKFGKAVLYATRDIQVPASFSDWAAELNANLKWPVIADIPCGGAIATGLPICTVFAEGGTPADVVARLRSAVEDIAMQIE